MSVSFETAKSSAAAQTLFSAFPSNIPLFRKFPVTNIYNKGKPREVYLCDQVHNLLADILFFSTNMLA